MCGDLGERASDAEEDRVSNDMDHLGDREFVTDDSLCNPSVGVTHASSQSKLLQIRRSHRMMSVVSET